MVARDAWGSWRPTEDATVAFSRQELGAAIARVREQAHIVRRRPEGHVGVAIGGTTTIAPPERPGHLDALATLPPLYPEWLGDRSFAEVHGVRFPYVGGEMANGIATVRMVESLARAGLMGFFGAAGLPLDRVEAAVGDLLAVLGPRGGWGVNLIHTPDDPRHEEAVADLLIRRGVPNVSASAFMGLTPAVVRCAAQGLHRAPDGRIGRRRGIFAKVSRPEVAEPFLSPAPEAMLRDLVERGLLARDEAALAARVPVAEDVTVEADSGGHTDGRPLGVLLPAMLALRDRVVERHGYERPVRIGAAGGLGTPAAVAAAFALGSAYVLTGSVNQAAVESGLSPAGKAMLGQADFADVAMAPAGDMFELGAQVQVLKRGTMFAARGSRLRELYQRYAGLADLPAEVAARLERELFRKPLADALADTRAYWRQNDPEQIERASRDPKHEMALVFRSYLGLSSRWAIAGDAGRAADFQIWCGPAMGAFNRWVKGSFLEPLEGRSVVQIALNLLEGATVVTRAQQLRTYGVPVPAGAFEFRPRPLA